MEIGIDKLAYGRTIDIISKEVDHMTVSKSYNTFQTRNMQTYKHYSQAHERLSNIVVRYKSLLAEEVTMLTGIEASLDYADATASTSITSKE